jgi:parvulin-like peptidyl-prolyl isomerase
MVPDLAYEPDAPPPKAAEVAPTNLPEGAPKSVVFGVILVEYRGAQGATRTARARDAADARAKELVEEAKKDFAAAVAKGDPGSMENAGAMPRGILEPGAEQALFTLAVGDVGGPVDTPRGLWIVKRIE